MLQPRRNCLALLVFSAVFLSSEGFERVSSSPRSRRQDSNDVTTVLLVDNHGRSSFGRYLSVKPDLGLITSTARTFIQEGVTTEYATQVLGTTLDNGRLYAHLLTKSSRVLYDGDSPSKSHENKAWTLTPTQSQPMLVFPTANTLKQQVSEEELLEEEPSSNLRVPYDDALPLQNNVKVFKINPQMRDLTNENLINHKEDAKPALESFDPSKVRPWDNLPTFTVRNEFSPSGFSYLGDFPEFDSNTEKTKATTAADRKAKLLFRAGLVKPQPRDFETITYSGFADFTTTVGDTVIVFTPHTSGVQNSAAEVTKISVEPTIAPTPSVKLQPTTLFHHQKITEKPTEPPTDPPLTEAEESDVDPEPIEVIDNANDLPKPQEPKSETRSMVIDKTDRLNRPQEMNTDTREDMIAKSAVLAHEQHFDEETQLTSSSASPEVIEPSESQTPMLSTPSDEDIRKIFAALQAQAKLPTQPLETPSTVFLEDPSTSEVSTGATTIFFEDTASEVAPSEIETVCTEPTTVYKTLTYLTTFFIPLEESTSTSVKSNKVVSTEVGFQTGACIEATPAVTVEPTVATTATEEEEPTTTTTRTTTEEMEEDDMTTTITTTTTTEKEKTTTTEELPTTTELPLETTEHREVTDDVMSTTPALETTPTEITTERRHVTESEPETTEMTTESGEEIELIFKTLYTTYTYLTTYFQDTTSSIASKIVVTTNVITSTLVPGSEASDAAVAGLFERDDSALFDIEPTKIQDFYPTLSYEPEEDVKSTPVLSDDKVQQNGVKTYYTTYTYFTTIFVDGETEISSRTEVYTNYVTPSIQATAALEEIEPTRVDQLEAPNTISPSLSLNVTPLNSYNSTISRQKTEDPYEATLDKLDNNILATTTNKDQLYVTLQRGAPAVENNDYETISTMVTDVRSSTSEGDRRLIDNVDKRNALDDQIVSESNNDSEIIPSPTLLLQTSYTTFTYFTTMYHGTTASDVVSRLETVTNVVTETLTPTHTLSPDDLSLPVTYFTTFTYWTTLYKDGVTKTTSREETVSNVVTPTPTSLAAISITATEEVTPSPTETVQPSTVGDDDLTTYFTTYTYYTTSYVGDSTVINSRLETSSRVINSTADIDSNQIGRAIGTATQNSFDVENATKPTGLLSTIVNTVENSGTTTVLSTDVFGTYIDGLYAKVLESTSSVITPTIAPSSVEQNLKPTGVVSLNKGQIVDADGISTLYYTTQAVGTYIDNLYAQVIESTSSLHVNEERKAALATDTPIGHKTGLVRLIEGSIVQNETTTLYQSKVLGTVIDGRYAQVIESTSSFLVGKTISPSSVKEIAPTATQAPEQAITSSVEISPSPVVIESSLSKSEDETSTEEPEEEEDEEGNTRSKSRLTFQSRKRTFTPVIRPFASRPRPTFAPKRKGATQGATTVTRSDVTPTVTAVPASKPARFGNRRSSSSVSHVVPTASGSRRFSRPKSTSVSSSFGGGRRSSTRIQPTVTGSRRGGSQRSSSLFAGSSRFRIRPTATLNRGPSTATPSSVNNEENDLTTVVTDSTGTVIDDLDTTLPLSPTTESSRRQNPLLKFRRPPLSRPAATSKAKPKAKPKATTTTPKPRTTFARQSSANRPRNNALFPRRNLFTTSTTPPPEDEDEDDLEEEGGDEDDTDYDSSQTNTQTEPAPTPETRRGRSFTAQIKPFVGFRKRTKREVNYSRFRRPGGRTTSTTTPEPQTEEPKPKSRFTPRTRTTTAAPRKRISPTKASAQTRSQFTLREKDTSRTNYRRPSAPRTTVPSRPKSPKLRTTAAPEPRKPTRGSSRRRTSQTRQRPQPERVDENFVIPQFDGTITVTHQIPTEVTIPVVNGKVTEYKNVITAKYSTEVLAPKQYSTSVNPLGKDVTVLLSEATTVADNGATLITQFVLNETPTTSVIFTPTYIRGRKTSFSHVIPSTAYGVDQVVNTIQPALAAQAPLANLLLSQLLLGQNPLYPIPNPGVPAIQATPTTEFKTKATTYVTTVTSVTSTVLPLTFRGKEILTTIIDSSVSVVTATEFLTETIVVTPTLGFPAAVPQFNTLLLPLLQQQLAQQQQQQQQQQQPAGVVNLNAPRAQALYQEPDKENIATDDDIDQAVVEEVTQASRRKTSRKKNKKPAPTEPPKETSVITLYVSGRIPGEFSTVLSTVTVGENDRRKRHVDVEVRPSKSHDDVGVNTLDYFDSLVTPASKEVAHAETVATESLESIIGDVTKHINHKSEMPTKNVTDLEETAPLIPKVETSLIRGNKINQDENYVSKNKGIGLRFRRDVEEPRRRVVKKLVRVQPRVKRPRRRLVVKKKKKRLITHSVKPRRRVVVTRKRPLLKTTESESNGIEGTGVEGVTTPTILANPTIAYDSEVEDISTPTNIDDSTENTIEGTLSSIEEDFTDFTTENTVEESGTEYDNTSTTTIDLDDLTKNSKDPSPHHVPDYEPFFPELSESLDAPVLLLKTTVISSIEIQTKTVVQSRLRTYTFIVTRVNGDEHVVTSTTEVRPQTKTTILTEPLTRLTTLTLLDFDATSTLNPLPMTPFPESPQLKHVREQRGRAFEEARYNLATRVMSNGVEVIVAGDKSTLPGEPDVKRVLPSTIYKPVTLKPSTLSDHMMMILPTNIDSLANQFVTKTCLTTFTYLTTFLEDGTTTVSSHEQVVSNIATEERNTGKILPTPAVGITLTQYPNLSVGVFHTTYTYLNTILDGEQPLVVTSKHTVTNTVTAPDDYLSLLQPSEKVSAIKDTNTYYSTVALTKTLYEGDKSQVVSTDEVVTQVVITESVPPKATSVMTSYIALDVEDQTPVAANYSTTDVVKTYFVTYTYYNTLVENGKQVVKTNISTSADVVTEKLFLHPKRTVAVGDDKKKQKIDLSGENFHVVATKTYHTTFTYFTTLLQKGDTVRPTVISSHSKVVENIVTETINTSLLDKKHLSIIKSQIREGSNTFTRSATLNDGQKLEITVVAEQISPTKVLPIERTKVPEMTETKKVEIEASTPSVVVGSTIIFLDDEVPTKTPSLSSSKVVKKTSSSKLKTKPSVAPTKSVPKPPTKVPVPDLLGLGSININKLTPVLNAMADLIQTNLKANRRNDSVTPKPEGQSRSPIYIPVGGAEDFEVAESQNIATFHLQETVDWKDLKPTHESPLLNGGIPISPGDVITANSDVIVGKPGRVGPRVPPIPLNQVRDEDDGYGMRPPPVWPKRSYEYKHIPIKVEKPIIHAPSKDDYVGPPPPLRVDNYNEKIVSNPIKEFNLQPSIVLPEVVERSTGQPLLVNIQPSQVAFVNIPHNRSTALIYGGSTEPHRNGQYFDDPSPYPQPEFSAIESFNNGLPQLASLYNGGPNQKQVGGVIKVAPQPIERDHISPSRPNPISFGMMEKDNEFNAHVINHAYDMESIGTVRDPEPDNIFVAGIGTVGEPEPVNRFATEKPFVYNLTSHGYKNRNTPTEPSFYKKIVGYRHPSIGKPFTKASPKPNYIRPLSQPKVEIPELPNYDRPSSQPKLEIPEFTSYVKPSSQPDMKIPELPSYVRPSFQPDLQIAELPSYARPSSQPDLELPDYLRPSSQPDRKIPELPNYVRPVSHSNMENPELPSFERPSSQTKLDIAEFMLPPPLPHRPKKPLKPLPIPLIPDDDEDLTSEDGEVFQESNSRPLRPGQLPYELLKTTTTIPPPRNDTHPRPTAPTFPRPFVATKPDTGFITYIGSITARPIHQDLKTSTTKLKRQRTTTQRPVYRNTTYGLRTRQPIPLFIATTTLKPIDNEVLPSRPKVTSLPIDPPRRTSKPLSITDLLKRERVTTPSTTTVKHLELNTGEVSATVESEMEIMRPPPRVEVSSPSGDIKRVPDLEGQGSTSVPLVPKPAEEIVPPPPGPMLDEVVGMSPPPLASTHLPVITTSTTSARPVSTRRTTRRPTVRVTTRRPARPYFEIYNRNRTVVPTETRVVTTHTKVVPTTTRIIPTSTKVIPTPIKLVIPSMEVIIGNPNNGTPKPMEVSSSQPEIAATTVTRTQQLPVATYTPTVTSPEATTRPPSTSTTTKTTVVTTPVHHAGNEIKIVDEPPKPIKTVLPTRFITHTQTSTVTITKTTVVKTPNGPPSTSTLLVTKTEKSTLVDTVTEFHTLLRPTNIIETVTTTVSTGSSLYPSDAYSSTYPSIRQRPIPTTTATTTTVLPTIMVESTHDDEDLEEFIITETDAPEVPEDPEIPVNNENESIFVVMTDKNKGSVIRVPNNSYETQQRDEVLDGNEANNVLLGGIFIASPPSLEVPRVQSDRCEPECKAARNELCQKVDGVMRCVCRPGFARMFPDRPCIPTYTYNLKVDLDRSGRENLNFSPDLTNPNSTKFKKLTALTHEALDRMVMQSDLRDIYHGVHVHSYEPRKTPTGVTTHFYLQLSDNTDETRLEDVFRKYLRNNNYSLGGTEMFASRESLEDLKAVDFDECTNPKFHDCSENAQCFNLKGTYTCSCKEGFADLSENILYPGRICSAELIGCERCNYHGTCYSRGDEQVFCECFHWYTGESCHINLKVLLIALVTLGAILFALLLICLILTCCRKKPAKTRVATGMSFLPQRVGNRAPIDRRAMIQDTSSEDSRSETNAVPPYVPKKHQKLKGALKKPTIQSDAESEQKDRSLTVMIPRAKYHPAPAPLSNYTSFDARKPSVPSTSNEAKLLSYLDAGPSPCKSDNKRKYSSTHSDSYIEEKPASRKTSGALVSAGFEVSATVLCNTLGTTCGTEADRSENATLIQKISADLLSSTGTRSQFNTLRDNDIDPMTSWLDITPRINTVSEARSYDETTIPPPMKSFRGDYDSKPSSQHQNDEANTMAERDVGSTFLLPHTHLYKPDRGSDISGFESL